MEARILFEKIWERYVVVAEEGELLLYVDRVLIHEGSTHAFAQLAGRDQAVARPRQVFAFTDHYVPTTGRDRGMEGIANPEIRSMVQQLHANAARHGITLFG